MKRFATAVVVTIVVFVGLRAMGLTRKPAPPPKPLFSFSASNNQGGEVSIRVGSDGKVELKADDGKGSDVHMTARKSDPKGDAVEVSANDRDDDDDDGDGDDDDESDD